MTPQNTILKNIVQFSGLVVGVPTSLPHLINVNGVPAIPQIAAANAAGYTAANIVVDAVNVTVTRPPGAPASVGIYLEHWHTFEDVTPPGDLAGLVPFVIASGGGGGGGSRVVLASGTIDGQTASYLNVYQLGPITRNAPAGDYIIGNAPSTDIAVINFATGVIALDGKPAVLTVIPWTPGFFRVLITHLDGTPVDAVFSLIVFADA